MPLSEHFIENPRQIVTEALPVFFFEGSRTLGASSPAPMHLLCMADFHLYVDSGLGVQAPTHANRPRRTTQNHSGEANVLRDNHIIWGQSLDDREVSGITPAAYLDRLDSLSTRVSVETLRAIAHKNDRHMSAPRDLEHLAGDGTRIGIDKDRSQLDSFRVPTLSQYCTPYAYHRRA